MSTPGSGPGAVFRRHGLRLAGTVALLLATLLAGIGLLSVSGGFLAAAALAVGGLAGGFNLFTPSAGIRALTFARIASRYAEKLLGHDATLRIARDLRVWFFRRALPLAPAKLGVERTGELLARLMSDIDAVDGLLVRALGPIAALGAMALVAVLAANWIHPPAGLLLLVLALVIGLAVPLVVALGGRRLEGQRAAHRGRLRTLVFEGLEGAPDLAALGAGPAWAARVADVGAEVALLDARRRRRLSGAQALHALLAAAGLCAMLWLALAAFHAGTVTATAAAGLVFLAIAVLEGWAGAGIAWQALQSGLASLARVRGTAMQAPAVLEAAAPRRFDAGPQPLRFESVRFAWPGAARDALGDVTFTLAPGERIAISGDSGSGKSTLSALMLRLWDPGQGRVRYGGVDLRDAAVADWHARIAWLPQAAPVFAGSLRDNLALADAGATDARMWDMLGHVRLDGVARALGGLDAWVGENGATLSSGQARRLALARALLRRADILLLDEPTEGLDRPTADAVLTAVADALDGRSLVLITHQTPPAGVIDRHYRIRDGRLHDVDA
ncbi:MAG TPA: thiol reductant ABC exporter subunit CydC [Luteimonas sp.]|nr:thiol reductant ABC exporter subunit CydC [Luteimonas sp.]